VKLRLRLLTLIAVLVSAALAGSFSIIETAARKQALVELDRSLQVAETVWNTLSQSLAQSLAAAAGGLAGEPGFARVLRGTDRATLVDYLRAAQTNNPALELILVVDASGRVLGSTEGSTTALDPSDPLLEDALAGQAGAAFWNGPPGFYLAAVSPVFRRDQVEAVVLVGSRLDRQFVYKLARDTDTQVALMPDKGMAHSTLDALKISPQNKPPEGLHILTISLRDYAGQPLARLLLGREIDRSLAYMRSVTQQLAWLGPVVVVLAFLVSIPLVGRMTNPVVMLEKTQAEMDAVFQANLDGLVALNQAGRVVSANPAAAICFGRPVDQLLGRSLEELLPGEVFSKLIAVPPHKGQLVQRCDWQREGRHFQLTRTFVASPYLEVGSVLVTRDRSHEHRGHVGSPAWLARLGESMQSRPQDEAGWWRWEKARDNLLLLAGVETSESQPVQDLEAETRHWIERHPLLVDLRVAREGCELPRVDLTRGRLLLLLVNLTGGGEVRLMGEGGGCWLVFSPGGPLLDWESEVVRVILEDCEGRLESPENTHRVWLPALI